jgi:hypothetical protein
MEYTLRYLKHIAKEAKIQSKKHNKNKLFILGASQQGYAIGLLCAVNLIKFEIKKEELFKK